VQARLKSKVYFDGLYDAAAFHIHPLGYVLALGRLIEQAGGAVYEGSRVTEVIRRGTDFEARTATGEVRARHVIHCSNAYDRRLCRGLGRAVLPGATYIAVTESMGDHAKEAIDTEAAVADNRRAGDYYRRIDDGRILWGGRITTRLSEPRRLAHLLRGDMLGVYPQLGNPRMTHAWSGLMGYALHGMPLIRELAPRQWVAAAFGGHGLNTTAMAGRLVARAIVQGDDEWRRFEPFGAAWVGGPLGRAVVQLGYWRMQIRDRLDEIRAGARSGAAAERGAGARAGRPRNRDRVARRVERGQ
jgi:glycine/D-amino acid oxidase-like deaminating enzyme